MALRAYIHSVTAKLNQFSPRFTINIEEFKSRLRNIEI